MESIQIEIKGIAEIEKKISELIYKIDSLAKQNNSEANNPKYLTKKQTAILMNCSVQTIGNLASKNEIKTFRIGKKMLFDYNEILEYIKGKASYIRNTNIQNDILSNKINNLKVNYEN